MSYREERRIARAVREAAEYRKRREHEPRVDARAWYIADAARRYGLPPEVAEQIAATRPAEILREARRLAVEHATAAPPVVEDQDRADTDRALVPGHATAHDDGNHFDAEEAARTIRGRW